MKDEMGMDLSSEKKGENEDVFWRNLAIGAIATVTLAVVCTGGAALAAFALAGSTAFAADQAFALGSGESVLLETVFDGKQDAYDTAFMVCDMLTMGYMDMCMQYRMTCGSQTANTADDATDETGQGSKNSVNMDASANDADDINGTGSKNAKASTNTTGNAADDAETSGTSGATGKKSGVYLEEGETTVESGGKSGPYAYLEDGPTVGEGKNFTAAQKQKMLEENMKRNGGVVKSDNPNDYYDVLVKPQKSMKGVTPEPNEWQFDHIQPKDKGGTNSYSNCQIVSRKYNREKWNK